MSQHTPLAESESDRADVPRVVIVGGGFAGISAARSLKKAKVRITLIDKNPYSTFQPLLYQVATSTLNPGDITYYLRAIQAGQKNLRVELGEVTAMDHSAKTVTVDGANAIPYDYLVVATGVAANYFGIPGARENALPLYTRGHALDVRDRIQGLLDATAKRPGAKIRMVVVGGGPTGVETAGALAEMRNKDVPVLFPEIGADGIEVVLIDMADRLLGPFDPKSSEYTKRALERRGVKLMFRTAVKEVRKDGALIAPVGGGDDDFLEAAVVLWASGVGVPEAVNSWGLPQNARGRILVDDRLRAVGFPNVFAAGDVASTGERGLPQLAQPAKQTGRHIGKAIRADLGEKKDPGAFKYKDLGIMATIGRAAAVAEIKHFPRMKGFSGWMTWNMVHIATLMGGRNRLASMVNLGTKYVTWRKSHSLIVGDISDVSKVAGTEGKPLSVARSLR